MPQPQAAGALRRAAGVAAGQPGRPPPQAGSFQSTPRGPHPPAGEPGTPTAPSEAPTVPTSRPPPRRQRTRDAHRPEARPLSSPHLAAPTSRRRTRDTHRPRPAAFSPHLAAPTSPPANPGHPLPQASRLPSLPRGPPRARWKAWTTAAQLWRSETDLPRRRRPARRRCRPVFGTAAGRRPHLGRADSRSVDGGQLHGSGDDVHQGVATQGGESQRLADGAGQHEPLQTLGAGDRLAGRAQHQISRGGGRPGRRDRRAPPRRCAAPSADPDGRPRWWQRGRAAGQARGRPAAPAHRPSGRR